MLHGSHEWGGSGGKAKNEVSKTVCVFRMVGKSGVGMALEGSK